MTVGERSHPDIAYTDAFGDDIRRLMLPDPHPVDQPAFALGLFAMAQSIAALLRITFPCKEFMGFKVCSLTDDIIIDEGICKDTGNYLDFNILTQVFYRMANTVTIDSHPETTFGDEYRKARMLVSDDARIRIGRYVPTFHPIRADKHHPDVGGCRYAMTGDVFTIYFIYSYMRRQRCG